MPIVISDEMNLSFIETWFLRHISMRKTDFEVPAYLLQEYGPEVAHLPAVLLEAGYLTSLEGADRLAMYTVPQLKNFLEASSLPTKGKKTDLVQAVCDNFPDAEIAKAFKLSKYALTEKGEQVIAQYATELAAKDASMTIEEYKKAQQALDRSGKRSEHEDIVVFAARSRRLESNQREITNHKEAGIAEYVFRASEDCSDACSALDGRTFLMSGAVIGVNFPPMHEDCVCYTVEIDPEDDADQIASGSLLA